MRQNPAVEASQLQSKSDPPKQTIETTLARTILSFTFFDIPAELETLKIFCIALIVTNRQCVKYTKLVLVNSDFLIFAFMIPPYMCY